MELKESERKKSSSSHAFKHTKRWFDRNNRHFLTSSSFVKFKPIFSLSLSFCTSSLFVREKIGNTQVNSNLSVFSTYRFRYFCLFTSLHFSLLSKSFCGLPFSSCSSVGLHFNCSHLLLFFFCKVKLNSNAMKHSFSFFFAFFAFNRPIEPIARLASSHPNNIRPIDQASRSKYKRNSSTLF